MVRRITLPAQCPSQSRVWLTHNNRGDILCKLFGLTVHSSHLMLCRVIRDDQQPNDIWSSEFRERYIALTRNPRGFRTWLESLMRVRSRSRRILSQWALSKPEGIFLGLLLQRICCVTAQGQVALLPTVQSRKEQLARRTYVSNQY